MDSIVVAMETKLTSVFSSAHVVLGTMGVQLTFPQVVIMPDYSPWETASASGVGAQERAEHRVFIRYYAKSLSDARGALRAVMAATPTILGAWDDDRTWNGTCDDSWPVQTVYGTASLNDVPIIGSETVFVCTRTQTV